MEFFCEAAHNIVTTIIITYHTLDKLFESSELEIEELVGNQ